MYDKTLLYNVNGNEKAFKTQVECQKYDGRDMVPMLYEPSEKKQKKHHRNEIEQHTSKPKPANKAPASWKIKV